jgi:hypothetical protein
VVSAPVTSSAASAPSAPATSAAPAPAARRPAAARRVARVVAPPPPRRGPIAAARDAAVAAGRSPWLIVGVILAAIAYVFGQRRMDDGVKLAHAGRNEPDDELIEL